MKKLIALMLAVLMSVPTLVACGDKEDDTVETKDTSAKTEDTAENEYAYIDEYVDDLAATYNFDGSTFTIIDNGSAFPAENEITGVLEDDALYNRYRELEEKFGVEIEMLERTEEGTDFTTPGAVIADDVKRDVMAGGSSYDLISGSLLNCGQILLNNNVIRAVNEMPGIDLEQSWWVQNLAEQVGLGDYLYSIFGKAQFSHYTTPSLVIYSKDIAEDYGVTENLYEVVQDGDWTVDKMMEVASVVPVNTSSTYDGTYKYFFSGTYGGYAWYAAAGYKVVERDENGDMFIENTLSNEKVDYIQKMASVLGDTTQNLDGDAYKQASGSTGSVLGENRFLFASADLGDVKYLRDEDIEIGILPMPKKDASQDSYYSFSATDFVMSFYFSQNLKDEEMAGVVTEAMAALSEKYVEPAYYEKALKGRSTYDVESRAMLDIIYSNEVVELADVYKWGEITDTINEAILGDSDSVVSTYNSSTRLANKNIQNTLKKVNKQND